MHPSSCSTPRGVRFSAPSRLLRSIHRARSGMSDTCRSWSGSTACKVRHVGHFAQLERQYCLFSTAGYMGTHSPDHADAGIWGLTELMLDTERQPNIRFPGNSGNTYPGVFIAPQAPISG